MAALLGVERGAVAAPRQPALVEPARRALHSKSFVSAADQNQASVHSHTSMQKSRKSTSAARRHRALHKAVE